MHHLTLLLQILLTPHRDLLLPRDLVFPLASLHSQLDNQLNRKELNFVPLPRVCNLTAEGSPRGKLLWVGVVE